MTNTKDWQAKKLGEVTDVYGGGTPSRSVPEYWGNDVPWLTMEDTNNLNVRGTVQYISNQGLQNSNAQLVPAGSVNLSCTASVGNVTINRIPLATNQQFNSFHPHKELIPEFLAYELMYQKNEIENLGGTTTIPFISKTSISNFQVYVPPVGTQKKIADILSTLDEAIQKTDQIIQKTEILKQGLMRELLTKGIGHKKFQKTKIGEIPEEWEIKTLDMAAQIVDSLHQTPTYQAEGIPMVRVIDVKASELDLSNCIKVSEEVYENFTKNHKPNKGDIVISRVGSFGVFTYVNGSTNFCLGQNTAIISPLANSKYLFYALQSPIPSNQVAKQVVGSNQKTLSLKHIRNLLLPIPTSPEQQKIAEILSELDKKISQELNEKEKMESLKKGLMQDIFSQKVQIN